VPAWFFGHTRACWSKGHAKCVKKNGTSFQGRDCYGKVDTPFKNIEADLHNLTPSVGELNGDRSNKPCGVLTGDVLAYGKCDFKIGGKPQLVRA
jgi:deoxyribonuclease-1